MLHCPYCYTALLSCQLSVQQMAEVVASNKENLRLITVS